MGSRLGLVIDWIKRMVFYRFNASLFISVDFYVYLKKLLISIVLSSLIDQIFLKQV